MSRISSAKLNPKISITGSSATLNFKRPGSERRDSVRDILVPCHSLNVCSTLWRKNDLRRVQTASKIVTKEERQKQIEKFEADYKRLAEESRARKRFLQELDRARDKKYGRNRDPFAGEKVEKETKILDRVFLAKCEQEEEVKRANRLILATKCHIVRDAQINEKKSMERDWRDSELRLEQQILDEDAKKLEEEKKHQQQLKLMNERHANELKKALEYRESLKYLEAQRIEDEAKALARAKVALEKEQLAKEREKQERIDRQKRDFQEATKIAEYYRNKAFEEKRAAEMKEHEYMRLRAERDKELERDRRLLREQKQREADRILEIQTQMLHTKGQEETMHMRRIQEKKEREYRKKEMENAIKRKEFQKQVIDTREKQIEEMKKARAAEEEQIRIESEKLMKKLKEAEEKEKVEKQKLHEIKENYRKDIITQIKQKEIDERKSKLHSRSEFDEEQKKEQIRQQNIRNVIAVKVNAMRESKIPEKFVRDVERQLKLGGE